MNLYIRDPEKHAIGVAEIQARIEAWSSYYAALGRAIRNNWPEPVRPPGLAMIYTVPWPRVKQGV